MPMGAIDRIAEIKSRGNVSTSQGHLLTSFSIDAVGYGTNGCHYSFFLIQKNIIQIVPLKVSKQFCANMNPALRKYAPTR